MSIIGVSQVDTTQFKGGHLPPKKSYEQLTNLVAELQGRNEALKAEKLNLSTQACIVILRLEGDYDQLREEKNDLILENRDLKALVSKARALVLESLAQNSESDRTFRQLSSRSSEYSSDLKADNIMLLQMMGDIKAENALLKMQRTECLNEHTQSTEE
ncbi:MAG: hypothetical protein K1060chlam2_00950 [Chlamydiae bacterium]|nr:hypothetical protein [Chlamydiota bacterium]